jgi:hypothetical protein
MNLNSSVTQRRETRQYRVDHASTCLANLLLSGKLALKKDTEKEGVVMHTARNRTKAKPKTPLHNNRLGTVSSGNQDRRIFIVSPTGRVTESMAEPVRREPARNR